ncbi:MAG: hypothetical protein ACTSWF_00515 [Candidatus Freyarchaeota archaeon]
MVVDVDEGAIEYWWGGRASCSGPRGGGFSKVRVLLDVLFIACYILGRLRDPVSIPCLVSKLEKFGEILSRQSERGMERWERYLIRIVRFPLKKRGGRADKNRGGDGAASHRASG